MMDLSKLVVGQHVTLSAALLGAGTTGVVREAGKYVGLTVAARIEGEDGAYYLTFHNDGNLGLFYSWTSGTLWWWAGSPCPIPDLRIIGIEEESVMKTDPNTTGPDGSVLVLCPKCEGRRIGLHKTAGHDAYLQCDDCGHVLTLAEMRGTDGD